MNRQHASNTDKVMWFVSSLEQKGGGERFALEGVAALKRQGVDTVIYADRLDQAASFDGTYDLSGVIFSGQNHVRANDYFARGWRKAVGVMSLVRAIRQFKPTLIICQSEFDAIRLYAASFLCSFEYRVFVFGQMYQFKEEYTRYASIFRPHLETIVNSRPGYKDTVALNPPSLSWPRFVINEGVARLKYRALRSAQRVFTLSGQVKWECSLVYGVDAEVLRAAFHRKDIAKERIKSPRPVGSTPRFLTVSRLVGKKRVNLIIEAFIMATLPPGSELRIVGQGPEEDKLKSLAAASEKHDQICFLGALSDSELHAELNSADCFVSMDIGDFDISVCEALARGIRVIVPHDFDVEPFGGYSGLCDVKPKASEVARAMEGLRQMVGSNESNFRILDDLTWESFASRVVS